MLQTRTQHWMIVGALLFLVALATLAGGRSFAQGKDIRYGDTGIGTIKAGARDDWHFVGSVGDVIALTVERTSGDLEPVLLLHDPADRPVTGTQAAAGQGSAALIQVRLAQTGPYRIQVGGSGQTAGEYALKLTLTISGGITPTPTLSATTVSPDSIAGTITYGATVQGELDNNIYRQSWRFRGNAGDTLDIRMTAASGNLNPMLALISPLGDIVAVNDSASGGLDAGILAFQLPYTGDYTIMARRSGGSGGREGTTAGRYSLTLTLRGTGTAAQNSVIGLGATVQGRLRDEVPQAVYRMEIGGMLAVNFDLGSLHRIARVRFLTTAGSVLASYQGISPLLVSTRLPDKGPFLVEVSSTSYENQPSVDFGLTIYRLSAQTTSAQPLHYGELRRVTSAISRPTAVATPDAASVGNERLFFLGRAGDLVSLQITPATAASKSRALLSGPQDTVLFEGNLGSGVSQVFALPESGPYEIEVQPAADESPMTYTAHAERIGANNIPFERFETAVDRGVLPLNAPVDGTLQTGIADGWWLDATAGQAVNLVASAASNSLLIGLALRRPDGAIQEVQIGDQAQGAVIGQALLEQTGRYRVVVFDSRDGGGGPYSLRYEEAWGGVLQAGQAVKGQVTPANGVARWSLDVTAGALINTRLTNLTPRFWQPTLQIAAPNGAIIAAADQQSPDASVDLLGVEAPVSGTYRVIVVGQVNTPLASYELLSTVQAPFATSSEAAIQVSTTNIPTARYAPPPPGGPIQIRIPDLLMPAIDVQKALTSNALALTVGATVRGEIAQGALVQTWRLNAVQGESLIFQATSLVGDVGPNLTLLDARGKIVQEAFHGNGATSVMTYTPADGGAHILVVGMGLDGGRYVLSLNDATALNGPLQVSAGAVLVYGQTVQGELLKPDATRTYYFFGTTNDVVSVQLARATGNLVPGLQLFSQRGTRLITDRNPNHAPTAAITNFRLPETGVYSIIVQHSDRGGDTTGRYALYVGSAGGVRLPNRGGGIITPGETVNGLLTVGDNEDTWLFQGRSGAAVSFVVTGLGQPLPTPLGVRLQDTNGRTIVSRDLTLTQSPILLDDVMLPNDGIYRVQVTGASQTEGAYSLTWQPDRSREVAGALNYSQTVNGVFTANRNADSWVFTGTMGDVISVVMRYQRGDPFRGGLQIRSENGVALITAADLGDGAGARVDNLLLPFSGSYTIALANPDPNFTGAGVYSLSVHLQDSKAKSMGGLLRYGEQGQGAITTDDPSDSWVFRARAGDIVRVSARAGGPFLRPQLELRNPVGVVLASALSNDSDRRAEAVLDKYTIDADGVYILTITGGTTAGDYLLALDYTPRPPAATETIQYGETKEGLIADDRPQQLRQFSGKAGDTITVRMTRELGSTLAAVVELRTPDGAILAQADSNGGDAAAIADFTLPYTGQYVLRETRFMGADGVTAGRYKVSLTGTTAPRPIKAAVKYGQLVIGRLDDERPTERITFTGKAGDIIGITSRATSGDLDTRLALENAAGETLAFSDDVNGTDAALSGILLPADGTYTVVLSRVGTKTVGTTGNYDLTVNLLYQVGATAAPQSLIAYGQRMVGAVDAQQRQARYTFNGNQGDEIAVRLIHQTDDAPPLLALLDPMGTVLANGTPGVGQTTIERYRLPASGLYTVAVTRPSNSQQSYSPYALTLTLLTSQPSVNSAQSTGGILRISDAVTGTFAAGQAAHYWLFQAKAGQVVTADLVQLNGDLLPAVILISPGGQGLTSASVAEHSQSTTIDRFTLPADGVYSLLVLPGGPNRAGQYRLTLQPNVIATLTPGTLTIGQAVSGTLDVVQPDQRWLFAGQQGQVITMRMLATGGNLSPHLTLISPDRTILAEGHPERTPQGLASVLSDIRLPVGGSYTLIAGQLRDVPLSAGTYRLLLETERFSTQAVVAEPITYGQPASKLAQQNTTDYWIFNGAAGDAVTFSVVSAEGNAVGPTVALQDMTGRTLAEEKLSAPTEATLPGSLLPANGRYIVAVPVLKTGSYTLLIQRRQSWQPQGMTPRTLTLNQALDGVITVGNLVNVWTFNGKAGDVARIDGARLSGDLRLDLTLYGPSGYVASALAKPDDPKVTLGPVRLPEGGTYLVVATRWLSAAGRTSGRYSLTLTNPAGVSGSQGGLITAYGQTVTGGILSNEDRWTFDGQAGDVVTVRMTRLDGSLIPTLQLITPDGATTLARAQGDQGEAALERVILPVSGLYTISAGRGGETSGGYRLTVERVQTAVQTRIERAAGIAYGEQRSGELTDKIPAQAWVFFGKAGERVTLDAAPAAGSKLDPYLYILAPDGSTLATDDNSGDAQSGAARIASVLLPADGFYGAVVSASPIRQGDDRIGAFTVQLQRSQPGAAYQGIIMAGGSVSSTLTTDQPIQEWTFHMPENAAGKLVVATVESPAVMFNTTLSIVSADGQRLAVSVPAVNGAASVEAILPGPGQYAVLVSANARGAEGRYTLTLSEPLSPAGQ
ncbi:MAG: hypothetical protein IT324_02255 [Anaerolineae bacterium]|nr:hypothetical protein [Anaerolineae bacterium]